MSTITLKLILSISGQYDPEFIYALKLDGRGISAISNLERCINLITLNLSSNQISRITGVEELTKLEQLDLSFNKIITLENISTLKNLQELDLRNNTITSLNDLQMLQDLNNLHSLKLQDANQQHGNPVCQVEGYVDYMMNLLPKLKYLDGISITLHRYMKKSVHEMNPSPDILTLTTTTTTTTSTTTSTSSSSNLSTTTTNNNTTNNNDNIGSTKQLNNSNYSDNNVSTELGISWFNTVENKQYFDKYIDTIQNTVIQMEQVEDEWNTIKMKMKDYINTLDVQMCVQK